MTRRQAREKFNRWLGELEGREGGRHFMWVSVMSHDADRQHFCFYVLVGGLHRRRSHYEQRWSERHSETRIERFDPSLHGIKHLVKAIDRDDNLEINYRLT
jgi:hypothetical protein